MGICENDVTLLNRVDDVHTDELHVLSVLLRWRQFIMDFIVEVFRFCVMCWCVAVLNELTDWFFKKLCVISSFKFFESEEKNRNQ